MAFGFLQATHEKSQALQETHLFNCQWPEGNDKQEKQVGNFVFLPRLSLSSVRIA